MDRCRLPRILHSGVGMPRGMAGKSGRRFAARRRNGGAETGRPWAADRALRGYGGGQALHSASQILRSDRPAANMPPWMRFRYLFFALLCLDALLATTCAFAQNVQ